jgi:hypothetical protein
LGSKKKGSFHEKGGKKREIQNTFGQRDPERPFRTRSPD